MKTIAKVLTSIACVALMSVSAMADKPHFPKHKTQKNTHSKLEHKHAHMKGERQMRKLHCESGLTPEGYDNL